MHQADEKIHAELSIANYLTLQIAFDSGQITHEQYKTMCRVAKKIRNDSNFKMYRFPYAHVKSWEQAGLAQWQSYGFVIRRQGFDSFIQLHFKAVGRPRQIYFWRGFCAFYECYKKQAKTGKLSALKTLTILRFRQKVVTFMSFTKNPKCQVAKITKTLTIVPSQYS